MVISSFGSFLKRSAFAVFVLSAVLASGGARADGIVYVNAAATGAGDGSSWVDAYTDLASAVTVANEAQASLYIAKGVYALTSALSVTNIPAIYGGFKGDDPEETVEARQYDVNKTVLTGDTTFGGKWVHIEPGAAGTYSFTKTVLDDSPLFVNGEFQLPPAFTADYDVYHAELPATSTEQAMVIKSGISGKVDGLWFVGFYGHSGGIVSYASETMAVDLVNCRFAGNISKASGNGAIVQNKDSIATKKLIGCRFMYATVRTCTDGWSWYNVSPICVYRGNSGLTLTDCEFLSIFGNTRSNYQDVWQGPNILYSNGFIDWSFQCNQTYRGIKIVRSYYRSHGSDKATHATIRHDNYLRPRFVDCVWSNNLMAVAASGYTTYDFEGGNCDFDGCTFANNRHDEKMGETRAFRIFGKFSQNQMMRWKSYQSCVFAGNILHYDNCKLDSGDITVSLCDTTWSSSYAGQTVYANCVFDSNELSVDLPEGVNGYLCRGVMVRSPAAKGDWQTGLANCTFVGPRVEGVKDLVQYGSNNDNDCNVVNCLFQYDGLEPYDGLSVAQPTTFKLWTCTLANAQDLTNATYDRSSCDYDPVPLTDGYVPQARPPAVRTSADLAYNGWPSDSGTSLWMTNYAFRAVGSESWQALVPKQRALQADVTKNPANYVASDLNGVKRPYGSVTRGAVQPLTTIAETGKTLTLRKNPVASGKFTGPQVQSVATGDPTTSVVASMAEGVSGQFDGWYTVDGDLYSTDASLSVGSLTDDLVLVAKFSAANTKLTFDLGEYGTFEADGKSVATVEAAPGSAFPKVPAYTLDAAWVLRGWTPSFPETVPAADATYVAKVLPSAVRKIYLVPEADAPTVQDGTSWATAYTNLQQAIDDAGLYRGEVRVKRGLYKVRSTVTMTSNVALCGGYAGEDEDEIPSPAENPVVFTGDVDDNLKWRRYASGTEGELIWQNGEFVPPPEGNGHWYPYGNYDHVSKDTRIGFNTVGSATNFVFEGVTLTGFYRYAIYSTAKKADGLRLRNCRIIANATYTALSGNQGIRTVFSDAMVSAEGCEFLGNYDTFGIGEGGSLTVTNCVFRYNVSSEDAAVFTFTSTGGRATVRDCVFEKNHGEGVQAIAYANVWMSSNQLSIEDCRIEGNTAGSLFSTYGSFSLGLTRTAVRNNLTKAPALSFLNGDGTVRVRDCEFSANTNDYSSVSESTGTMGGVYCGQYDAQFVNTTFDGNVYLDPNDNANAKRGTFVLYHNNNGSDSLVFDHCTVNGTELPSGVPEVCIGWNNNTTAGTVSIVNSIFENAADGYQPLRQGASHKAWAFARSYIRHFSADGLSGIAFNTGVVAEGGSFVAPRLTAYGQKPCHRAAADALSRNSLKTCLAPNGADYLYSPREAKPWRKLSAPDTALATVSGLTAESPAVPDANGLSRDGRYASVGPIATLGPGLMLLVR